MKIATRIPVLIPSINGAPYLCGVDVTVNVAQYDNNTAPLACVVETLPKGGNRSDIYRHTGTSFIKPVAMDPRSQADDEDALTSFSARALLDQLLDTISWNKVRRWDDPAFGVLDLLNIANSNDAGRYKAFGEAMRRIPSPNNIRKGVLDPVAVDEAIEKAVAALCVFCQVGGSWHSACGEPAIVNNYEAKGVRRFAREFEAPLQMPTVNYTWTMFPVSEYATAVGEPAGLSGWRRSHLVIDHLLPPKIMLPDVFGVDFLERETARHLRCLPNVLDDEMLTKGRKLRRWVSDEMRATRDALERELASEDLVTDPGPAVEAARTLVEMLRPRLDDGMGELGWRGLAMIERTITRWDDRPVRVNDIVSSPSGPR